MYFVWEVLRSVVRFCRGGGGGDDDVDDCDVSLLQMTGWILRPLIAVGEAMKEAKLVCRCMRVGGRLTVLM